VDEPSTTLHRTDDDVGAFVTAVRTRDVVATVGVRLDRCQLVSPLDRPGGQRADEQVPEFSSVDLGPRRATCRGCVVEDDAAKIDDAFCILTWSDQREELVVEPRGAQCRLTGVVVQVEQITLRASPFRGLALEHVVVIPAVWSTRASINPPNPAPMMVTDSCTERSSARDDANADRR